jgi:imidazole glycerol-phosphate synthase subunit HisH
MIAIIDGCGTNIASVQYACQRLGKNAILTKDKHEILASRQVILPGVGTAKKAMEQLTRDGLRDVIIELKQPVLGICVGMQILYDYSAEGNIHGLGIFPGKVIPLPQDMGLTIPHMGWNRLHIHQQNSVLLKNIDENPYVYFVHSYAAPYDAKTIASTWHGIPFAAMVQEKNFYGVQFHPERSGTVGEMILQNFLNL